MLDKAEGELEAPGVATATEYCRRNPAAIRQRGMVSIDGDIRS